MTAVPATLRLRREGVLRSRAARGDTAAFAAVYERHHQALYRYCRSILRHEEDAQDALQSTMARAFAALQDESRDFELRPWLFRIAHNEAISILRRRRPTADLDDVPALPAELDEKVSDREELRLLAMDLADLPERQRAALVLRELNGLSHAEIAVVLDINANAVKQSIFEARTSLFSCREGRAMACADVRRMLSDADGRVLRGRGVRAHLRTCVDCRRFQADIEHRSVALQMLAPPLPAAGAASLFAQLVGGSSAAKLLACVAIAGGGAAAVVEVQRAARPADAAEAPRARQGGAPALRAVVPTALPAALTPAQGAQPWSAAGQPGGGQAPAGQHAWTAGPLGPAAAEQGEADGGRSHLGSAVAPSESRRPGDHADLRPAGSPEHAGSPWAPAAQTPPGQAHRGGAKSPPGQAKERAGKTPSGQAKERAEKTPPKAEPRTSPPKAQARTTPPGHAEPRAGNTPPAQAKPEPETPRVAPGQANAPETKGSPAHANGQERAGKPAMPPGQVRQEQAETPAAVAPAGGEPDHPAPGQAKKEHFGN